MIVNSLIDHTILKPDVSRERVLEIGKETLDFQFASACVPPSFVKNLASGFPTLEICTVIGFPLGYTSTASKLHECQQAIIDGASELDVVVNASFLKSNMIAELRHEMTIITDFVHEKDKKVKWIFENSRLSQEDIINLCNLCNEVKPDFAKTSTGFGRYGARIEDVQLMKQMLIPEVKIKASGGIRTFADAKAYINLGVSRIGTSSGTKIVSEYIETQK